MSYLALYRKYRPTTFDGVIGQDHIVKTLINQVESQRFGHAYLFTGTRGTGKTSTAKIFAKAINCLSPVNGSPCGKCSACNALSDVSNIDVIEIDAASNNGVNEIRELRENVQFPPVSCRYKVYIIDEVHMLTGPAFNALLKTLEEPPKHVVFILATTEVNKIPATILSRCMRFDFRLVDVDKITELISDIFDKQNKKYEKEAVFAIAKAGEGSIRDALSVADTAFSYSSDVLTYDDVMDILGSTNSLLLYSFIENVFSNNTGKVLSDIDKFSSLGKSVAMLIKDVTKILRDILIIKTCVDAKKMLLIPQQNFNALLSLSELCSNERLLRILEIFAEAENNIKYTNNQRVVFETASVKATRPETDYNLDALISRIKALEDKISISNALRVSNEQSKVYTNTLENGIKPTFNEVSKPTCSKISIKDVSSTELKGKILSGLRSLGSEMLWNLFQNVELEISDKIVYLVPKDETDMLVLEKPENIDKILSFLSDYEILKLEVRRARAKIQMDKIEDATEKIKKIFGEDIVIIKNENK